jgi:diaminohydroxyphosphoribosylaminopyrimidine deaminase/5-amino-6-(5-phosphoribosylamino)uracil reductase
MAKRSPVRVILDRDLRLPPVSRLARSAQEVPVWVVTAAATDDAEAEPPLRHAGVEVLRSPPTNDRLELQAAVTLLAARGITRLMVEGGPTVAAALVTADLVDEAVLLRSPVVIGPDGVDALNGLPLTALTQSSRLRMVGRDAIGGDIVERYERT